jgi:hypothetical protein
MTVEIGTASSAFDLFEKLRTFLTVTLPVNERWQELYHNPDYTLMVGVFASSGSVTMTYNPFNAEANPWTGTNGAQPWNIGIEFNQPVHLSAADITALTNNAQPAVINFQYSDDGLNWTTQDSFSGMTSLDWNSVVGIKHFNLTGTSLNKHKFWRLNIPDSTDTPPKRITLNKIVLWQDSTPLNVQLRKRLSLKGPGGGSDEIFVNLETDYSVSGDWYNWRLYGAIGFIADNALDFATQPGKSLPVGLSLWNSSIPYWFIANGRRFMVIAKINTTYHALYAGFILPYATPSQYPYPLMIGGSNAMGSPSTDSRMRWSSTNDDCRNFYDPGGVDSGHSSITSVTTNYLRFPDGSWYPFKNWYTSGSNPEASVGNGRNVWPWGPNSDHATAYKGIVTAIDGSYVLFPCIMHVDGNNPSPNILGELHGVFAVTGFGNAAENTTTINGVTYLIVPNVFRAQKERWAAIALE